MKNTRNLMAAAMMLATLANGVVPAMAYAPSENLSGSLGFRVVSNHVLNCDITFYQS